MNEEEVSTQQGAVEVDPCPFCAGDHLEIDEKYDYSEAPSFYVKCCSCGAQGPEVSYRRFADVAWSLRK